MTTEPKKPEPIACAAGCARTVADDDAASAGAWSYLAISRRWRCPTCRRELDAAQAIAGGTGTPDEVLPPDSRGALRRETASTVLPPSVKG
jgi:hypothetical protein